MYTPVNPSFTINFISMFSWYVLRMQIKRNQAYCPFMVPKKAAAMRQRDSAAFIWKYKTNTIQMKQRQRNILFFMIFCWMGYLYCRSGFLFTFLVKMFLLYKFKYCWLSLSRTRLSRITTYLEVKICSLPKHGNLATCKKNIVEKRRNRS